LNSKVSFKNNGTASATVTVTITGYSTQTTASNISGSGGSGGQVLTNNGAGGASWTDVAHSYSFVGGFSVIPIIGTTPIGSLAVPAGLYTVSAVGSFQASGGGRAAAQCTLRAPNGGFVQTGVFVANSSDVNDTAIALQGVITTAGGQITVSCVAFTPGAQAGNLNLIAVRVGATTGQITTAGPATAAPSPSGTGQLPVK
jgi:hypothetical protein